ncbi:MAG: CdaR family protein [Planctomycetota bacterium]
MIYFKKIITENIGTKITALFLSFLVWYYIGLQLEKPLDMTAQIKIETPSQILSRVETQEGELISELSVKLKYAAKTEPPSNLVCKHRIANLNPDILNQIFIEELSSKDFKLAPGIKIISIVPSKVRVVLYKEGSKYMKIRTDNCIKGSPEKEYRVAGVRAEPSDILVKGPLHILNKYDNISIMKIDVTGHKKSFSRTGQIEPLLDNERISSEDKFNVEINIQPEMSDAVFQVPIKLLMPTDFPYQIQLKSKERGVKVRGPLSSIKLLKIQNMNLFVNIASLYNDITEVKPPMSFTASLEFKLTPDAPKDIELSEPIEQITLDIMAPQPPVQETTKPPVKNIPQEPPKTPEPPNPPDTPK